MAAENEVVVDARDRARAEQAIAAAVNEVRRIEAKYSRYRADSVVSRINGAAGGDAVALDAETSALLQYADTCHEQSNGLFDPTSGVLRRAWSFGPGSRVPATCQVEALLRLIGWDTVERSVDHIRLPLAGMELDLGGIGKEYAADRAAEVLRGAGVVHGYVNLAGDLAVLGPQANGDPWWVGVRHPRVADAAVARVPLQQGGIATSGDYERFFEQAGTRYCHLLNPRTGFPVHGLQSVTVWGPSCLVAGSLASIAMLKGNEGAAWLARQQASALWVDAAGEVGRCVGC
jgi:thiamine biosynthesis lipoprotein